MSVYGGGKSAKAWLIQYKVFMQKLQKTNKKVFKYLIGIDEVGRGPVAGPVAVCASLILFNSERKLSKKIRDSFESRDLPKLHDSKRLSKKGREDWQKVLIENEELKFEIGYMSAKEIDKRGIAVCIRLLVKKNLINLQKKIGFKLEEVLVLLDGGLKAPQEYLHQETIIKGDDKEPIISFASIHAKVSRDNLMTRLAKKFPEYNFETHKGYGTKKHIEAIKKHGATIHHRKTFLKSHLQ